MAELPILAVKTTPTYQVMSPQVGDTAILPITLKAATGNEVALTLDYTVNKLSGDDTGLLIKMTDTASPGTSLPLEIKVGGVSKFSVDADGVITSAVGTLISDMAETWNNAGTVFTAIKMSVTNTASASGSKLFDLLLGGSSVFAVRKDLAAVIANDGWIEYTGPGLVKSENGYLKLLALGEMPSGASPYIRSGNSVDMTFGTNNTSRWKIDRENGHFLAATDDSYDIGASGATRPRNGYFSGTLSFGAHSSIVAETITGYITISDAGGTPRKIAVVS